MRSPLDSESTGLNSSLISFSWEESRAKLRQSRGVAEVPGGVTRCKTLFRVISTSNRNWSNGTIWGNISSPGSANLSVFIAIQRQRKRYRSFSRTFLFSTPQKRSAIFARLLRRCSNDVAVEIQLAVKSGALFSPFRPDPLSAPKETGAPWWNLKYPTPRYTAGKPNRERPRRSRKSGTMGIVSPGVSSNQCANSYGENRWHFL